MPIALLEGGAGVVVGSGVGPGGACLVREGWVLELLLWKAELLALQKHLEGGAFQ